MILPASAGQSFRDGAPARLPLFDWACLVIIVIALAAGLQAGSRVPFGYLPSIAALGAVSVANILRRWATPGGLLVNIGKASFSLYVLHFFVMWTIMPHIVSRLHANVALEWLAFVPLFLAGLAAVMIMAGLSKRLIEDRFNDFARQLVARREAKAASLVEAGTVSAEKLDFVDQMRGIAILGVMLVHFSQDFSSVTIRYAFDAGRYGVQVFFFISAFTLCLSHDRRRGEVHAASNFMLRRFFRVAPMYYIGITGYALRAAWHGHMQSYSLINVLANMLFVHSLIPAANSEVVPGGWTLANEFIFYAILPWLFPIVERAWQRHGAAGLIAFLLLVIGCSYTFQAGYYALNAQPVGDTDFGNHSFPLHFPAFAFGIAYYFACWRDGPAPNRPLLDWIGLIGLVLICAIGLGSQRLLLFGSLPLFAGAAAYFLANIMRRSGAAAGLLCRIGQLSLSLYVLHFMVMWYAARRIVTLLGGNPTAEGLAFMPIFLAGLAVLVLAANLTKLLVEDRFKGFARTIIARREAAAGAVPA